MGTFLLLDRTAPPDTTAEAILARFSDARNCPEEALAPYEEFSEGRPTTSPPGFLYRKYPGTEEIGGYFCGFLPGEAWHYRTNDS